MHNSRALQDILTNSCGLHAVYFVLEKAWGGGVTIFSGECYENPSQLLRCQILTTSTPWAGESPRYQNLSVIGEMVNRTAIGDTVL